LVDPHIDGGKDGKRAKGGKTTERKWKEGREKVKRDFM
jgi:hypothetical protein